MILFSLTLFFILKIQNTLFPFNKISCELKTGKKRQYKKNGNTPKNSVPMQEANFIKTKWRE